MAFTKNEEAVSPVIGVILMVAITVILAAVIAAFVFGMAGNISKTKVVAATVQQPEATYAIATFQGGQDAATCDFIQWKVNDTFVAYMCNGGTDGSSAAANCANNDSLPVGTTQRLSASAGKDQITATAHFTDGTSQVIVDTTI